MTDVRVTQAPAEVVLSGNESAVATGIFVSQAVFEAVIKAASIEEHLTQAVAEIVHPFECDTDTPSEPVEIPTTTLVENIRRQRRTPHLSAEEAWLLYTYFQLDCEVGVGLDGGDTVQGHDPQLMMRYSDDGGHTWSSEHWVSAGKLGEYKWRAIWRRLGRSRNRMFEITVTDPVKWTLIEAYLGVRRGRR